MKLANVKKIVNLTPRAVSVICAGNKAVKVPVSGVVARLEVSRTAGPEIFADPVTNDAIDGIRIWVTEIGRLSFVNPEGEQVAWRAEDDTLYIVSDLVRTHHDRPYFVSPGEPIVTVDGVVVACRGLTRSKWIATSAAARSEVTNG